MGMRGGEGRSEELIREEPLSAFSLSRLFSLSRAVELGEGGGGRGHADGWRLGRKGWRCCSRGACARACGGVLRGTGAKKESGRRVEEATSKQKNDRARSRLLFFLACRAALLRVTRSARPAPPTLSIMAESHFASLEEQDGVRLTWNVWPATRLEAAKCVVPLAAVYSPVKALASMPVSVGWRGERRDVPCPCPGGGRMS